MIKTISVLGSSSGRNAGDAALIAGLMEAIDGTFNQRLLYEIPTINERFIWNAYPNRVRPVSMMPWALSVKMLGIPTLMSMLRADLSLVFDAILFDRSLYNPLFNHMSTLRVFAPLAKKKGRKLGYYNVGVGPITTPAGAKIFRELSEMMDFITVRDQASYNILRDCGVKNPNVLLTADAALNVTASPKERIDQIFKDLKLDPNEEVLGINVSTYLDSWTAPGKKGMSREKFVDVFSKALNIVTEQIGKPILLIGTQHDDVPLSKAIQSKLTNKVKNAICSNIEYSLYDIKGILGRVSLLFAMRLHAVILASSELAPVSALPHQPKVHHYLETLGLSEYGLTFEGFSSETVSQHILKAWEERKKIKNTLENIIPKLKNEALKAAELVFALDQGEDISSAIQRLNQRSELKIANQI
jgi:polysaccharide pyruvyl transferase WcaK-like protein